MLMLLLVPISLLALVILAPLLVRLAQIGFVALFFLAVAGVAIWIAFDVVPPALWQGIFEALGWVLGVLLWLAIILDCWEKLRAANRWWQRILPVAGLILCSLPVWLAVLLVAELLEHTQAGHLPLANAAGETQSSIARTYNVSQATISRLGV